MTTPNLSLPELIASQAQPHVPVNSALRLLDVVAQPGAPVIAIQNAPPGSPADGDCYIVGSSPTGAWVGHAADIAAYIGTSWQFLLPAPGWTVYNQATFSRWIYGTGSPSYGWDEETSDSSSVGRHAVYIPAAGMSPSATGGCAALATIASAANQPDIQTLDFDPTTQEFAQFSFRMPKSWDEGTITFAPVWSHAATTTNFGVVWELQAVAVSNDDVIAVAYGTAQSSTDTGGTTDDLYVGPESAAIMVGGTPAGEDMVFFRLARAPSNGSDTMAIDARLHGITVYITTNAETDA